MTLPEVFAVEKQRALEYMAEGKCKLAFDTISKFRNCAPVKTHLAPLVAELVFKYRINVQKEEYDIVPAWIYNFCKEFCEFTCYTVGNINYLVLPAPSGFLIWKGPGNVPELVVIKSWDETKV